MAIIHIKLYATSVNKHYTTNFDIIIINDKHNFNSAKYQPLGCSNALSCFSCVDYCVDYFSLLNSMYFNCLWKLVRDGAFLRLVGRLFHNVPAASGNILHTSR